MPNLHELENAMPVAPLKIIALPSAEKMGRRINDYMVEFRKSIHNDKVKNDPAFHGYIESNYLVDVDVPRFGSGEAKAQISETIRGKDLFILTDVCNHSITYNMNGYTNHMSPDDHYQDLKRVIAACNGKARRIKADSIAAAAENPWTVLMHWKSYGIWELITSSLLMPMIPEYRTPLR